MLNISVVVSLVDDSPFPSWGNGLLCALMVIVLVERREVISCLNKSSLWRI